MLGRALAAVTGWLNSGAAAWPDVAAGGAGGRRGPDRPAAADGGRLGGPVTQGAYQAGDGTASVTAELVGEHATVTLSLLVNPSTGELRQADVAL